MTYKEQRFISYSPGGWVSEVKGLNLVRTPLLHHLMVEDRWARDPETQHSTHLYGKPFPKYEPTRV